MTMTLENKRAARNQLVDPGTDKTQATEVITSAEVAFITATVDLKAESNPILLCTEEKQQFDITDTIPNDGPISEKLQTDCPTATTSSPQLARLTTRCTMQQQSHLWPST
jgi:hypothetical protein